MEDVALAKRAKKAGYRIWFGPGAGVVSVRMYRSFAAMWEGWKKNLYLLVGGTPGAAYRELVSVVPWIPFALLVLGLKAPIAFVAGVGLFGGSPAGCGGAPVRYQNLGAYRLYFISRLCFYVALVCVRL